MLYPLSYEGGGARVPSKQPQNRGLASTPGVALGTRMSPLP